MPSVTPKVKKNLRAITLQQALYRLVSVEKNKKRIKKFCMPLLVIYSACVCVCVKGALQ